LCANSQTKHGPWHLLFTAPCDGLFLHRGALFGPVGAPPACGAASCSKTPSSPVFARSTTTALLLSAPTAKTCCLMASPFHCPGVRSGPNVRLISGESLALTRSPEEAKQRLFLRQSPPRKFFCVFFSLHCSEVSFRILGNSLRSDLQRTDGNVLDTENARFGLCHGKT